VNIEELKLIIEAVKGLAGDTKEAVIWYLVARFGSSLITDLLIVGMVVFVAILAYKAFLAKHEKERKETPLEEFNRAVTRLWLYAEEDVPKGEAHRLYTTTKKWLEESKK
jgi:large-conductance mechanosensitive channel